MNYKENNETWNPMTKNGQNIEVRDLRRKEKFVVDDAYLNGYARKCGVYATAVYLSLCRHADKEQKCWPSIRLIAEEHSISEKQVGRAIKILEQMQIILKQRIGKKATNRYWLRDRSEWTNSPYSDRTISPIATDPQSDQEGTDSPFHSKDTHRRIHIEGSAPTDGAVEVSPETELNKQIGEVIKAFTELNPACKRFYGNKTQRKASNELIVSFGFERVKSVIERTIPKTNTLQYFPTITTPLQLLDKWTTLEMMIRRKQGEVAKTPQVIST